MWRVEDTAAVKAIGSVASNRRWLPARSTRAKSVGCELPPSCAKHPLRPGVPRSGDGSKASPAGDRHAHDLARLAFGGDFKGAAADFAVGDETLGGDAGVEHQFHALAAEGAVQGRGGFHVVEGGGWRIFRQAASTLTYD